MLFNQFEDNDKCSSCGKNYQDICDGKDFCQKCFDEGEVLIAKMTVLQHFMAVFVAIFNFEFKAALLEAMWTVERLFAIGDYGRGGYFEQRGIKWWEKNE